MPMKNLPYIIILLFVSACKFGQEIPKIVYKQGDLWINNFRNNSFPSKVVEGDKLYCSSINTGEANYLYCLNLKTGVVDWVTKVDNWASSPPIVGDSFIYFCSFVGDIYKFNKNGNEQWRAKLDGSFGAELTINPTTNNLFVKTVQNGIIEYDFYSGDKVNIYGEGQRNVTLPVFESGKMFIGNMNLGSNKHEKSLLAIEKGKTSIILKRDIGDFVDRIFVRHGHIFYVDELYRLKCLNSFSGDSTWQSKQLSSKEGFMTRNPHLIFLDTSLLFYDSDQDQLKEINLTNGLLITENSFKQYVETGVLKFANKKYKIINGNNKYEIQVLSSLPVDSEKERVDIEIIKGTNS